MGPIEFGNAAWATMAANEIVRIDTVEKPAGRVFNTVLGNIVVAREGNAQLVLARKTTPNCRRT
jgi:hypothetical protein